MNLQDVFDELTFGELSQMAIGGAENEDPEICENDRPQIIRHINTALTAIYTRFRLREKTVFLQVLPGKDTYALDERFVISNTASSAPLKYLVDSEDDKFDNSLLKVEQVSVLRSDIGMPPKEDKPYHVLPLNEVNNPYSIRTPSLKTLHLPMMYTGDRATPLSLKIEYRARHPVIDIPLGQAAPIAVDIELPSTHLQAMLFHVASRIMNPTGMIQEFHSGNSWYAKYESECARLEHHNVQIDNEGANMNFERQGFV